MDDMAAHCAREAADLATRLLCELCKKLGKLSGGEDLIATVSKGELSKWLETHAAVDARRIRKEAMAKLTPEEIEALGLKGEKR
jgi:ABC-type uncharacterized transport system permease subunit